MRKEFKEHQVTVKLNDTQFDKLQELAKERRLSKQDLGVMGFKLLFLLWKGSYRVVDKNGNPVELFI